MKIKAVSEFCSRSSSCGSLAVRLWKHFYLVCAGASWHRCWGWSNVTVGLSVILCLVCHSIGVYRGAHRPACGNFVCFDAWSKAWRSDSSSIFSINSISFYIKLSPVTDLPGVYIYVICQSAIELFSLILLIRGRFKIYIYYNFLPFVLTFKGDIRLTTWFKPEHHCIHFIQGILSRQNVEAINSNKHELSIEWPRFFNFN